jgi:hypothetical protein
MDPAEAVLEMEMQCSTRRQQLAEVIARRRRE